jgi:hypothetical protein
MRNCHGGFVVACRRPAAGRRCLRRHAATPLPGDSICNTPVQLTTQEGLPQLLSARRGRPQLVTMFYTRCQMVCPMIIDSLRMTRNALDPAVRSKVGLLAVSFDPGNDDVATLRSYAEKRKPDPHIWTLARATPAQVRQLPGGAGSAIPPIAGRGIQPQQRADRARYRTAHGRAHIGDRQPRPRVREYHQPGSCTIAGTGSALVKGRDASQRTSGRPLVRKLRRIRGNMMLVNADVFRGLPEGSAYVPCRARAAARPRGACHNRHRIAEPAGANARWTSAGPGRPIHAGGSGAGPSRATRV